MKLYDLWLVLGVIAAAWGTYKAGVQIGHAYAIGTVVGAFLLGVCITLAVTRKSRGY